VRYVVVLVVLIHLTFISSEFNVEASTSVASSALLWSVLNKYIFQTTVIWHEVQCWLVLRLIYVFSFVCLSIFECVWNNIGCELVCKFNRMTVHTILWSVRLALYTHKTIKKLT